MRGYWVKGLAQAMPRREGEGARQMGGERSPSYPIPCIRMGVNHPVKINLVSVLTNRSICKNNFSNCIALS